MSEANSAPEAESTEQTSAPDQITNIKAEMARKVGNLEAEMQALKQANQALMERLQPKQTPAPASDDDINEDEIYTNPKGFANKLVNKVSTAIESKLETRTRAEQERMQVLTSLAAEYPELNQQGSELYNEAINAINSLPPEQRNTPIGYRLAVNEAAAKTGTLPKSKRKDTSMKDDFSFSGKGSQAPKKKSSRDEVDSKVLTWAELLGLDVKDDKTVDELKELSKRDWRKPQ